MHMAKASCALPTKAARLDSDHGLVMKRFLLLGKHGQLGWELQRCLQPLGEVQALDYPEIDLAEPEQLRTVIRAAAPDVIVNATAYTAVDRAESEPGLAFAVNADSPKIMAEEAKKAGAVLVHFSTDYVFDGRKGAPYVETDLPNPINVYGESKLAGERAIQAAGGNALIFRTAWVYSLRGEGFVTKALQWARQNESVRIVDDQVSNPTWARMLAQITALLLGRGADYLAERGGLYHLAGGGYASRYEWAEEIYKRDPHPAGRIMRHLERAASAEFSTPAERPLFSALACGKFEETFHLRIPPWQADLELALTE